MRSIIFSLPYLISNVFAILVLVLAVLRPVTARVLLCLIFGGAAVVNAYTALVKPEIYLSYGDLAVFPLYEQFIRGAFAAHITAWIIAIAVLQILMSVFIGLKGNLYRLALAGAATFLVAIAPLGAGAAFPCSLILAVACFILLERDNTMAQHKIFYRRHTGVWN